MAVDHASELAPDLRGEFNKYICLNGNYIIAGTGRVQPVKSLLKFSIGIC